MKALSVRQPWAHAIFALGKDVENRSRRTSYRGEFLIHASLKLDKGWQYGMKHAAGADVVADIDAKSLPRGVILGKVELVDVVRRDNQNAHLVSEWYWGFPNFAWILRNPVIFDTPVEYKGRLGFFEVPGEW